MNFLRSAVLFTCSLFIFTTGLFSGEVLAQTNLEWARSIAGSGSIFSESITTDQYGNVYMIGNYRDSADFDPDTTISQQKSNGGWDVFIVKLDNKGQFRWAISQGNAFDDQASSLVADQDGNVYISGWFKDTLDFDPDSGSYYLGEKNKQSAFVQKLDSNGHLLWAAAFESTGIIRAATIDLDTSGNILLAGNFEGTVDFDPGPGTHNLTVYRAAYVLKLDASGNLLWVHSLAEQGGNVRPNCLTTDVSGHIYMAGEFSDTVDFDPGPGNFPLIVKTPYISCYFVLKLDPNGDFVWVKAGDGTKTNSIQDISIDMAGNIYTTGIYHGTLDVDPSAAVYNLDVNGAIRHAFVMKLSPDGTFQWAKSVEGGFESSALTIFTDEEGYSYIGGDFIGNVDFDPGLATYPLNTQGLLDAYVWKLDPDGNFIWVISMGSTENDATRDLSVDQQGYIYATGMYKGTVDFDPDSTTYLLTSLGGWDLFVEKLKQSPCANLALIVDSVTDVTCTGKGYASGHAIHGQSPYQYVWDVSPKVHDSILIYYVSGIYTLEVTDSLNCKAVASVLVSGPSSVNGFDLSAHLIADNMRPGQPAEIQLEGFNDGCVPKSGELTLTLDSRVNMDSSTISPSLQTGNRLIWNFTNLRYDTSHLKPRLVVTPNTSLQVGDTLCFELNITLVPGDVDTLNNSKRYCFPVVNSYDPNDIRVYPQGVCKENYVLRQAPLTYMIRFQNTGNAEAINVHIVEKLPPALDIRSVSIKASSHKMYTNVLADHVLDFRFDGIHLPNSLTDEAGSKGYVVFEVMPYPTAADETVVENSVEIYFDYNPAILTNTVRNTLISALPPCAFANEMPVSFLIYPNPGASPFHLQTQALQKDGLLSVYNSLGQLVHEQILRPLEGSGSYTLPLSLESGLYLIRLKADGRSEYTKLIVR